MLVTWAALLAGHGLLLQRRNSPPLLRLSAHARPLLVCFFVLNNLCCVFDPRPHPEYKYLLVK
jgi:hypothetical protein